MNKHKELALEQALDQYFSQPAPRKEFLAGLEQQLQAGLKTADRSVPANQSRRVFRPAYAFLTLGVILVISLLVIGPANVFAALQGLIRYIPGFGLVEEQTPLRALAEPVSVTRDGVTVTVTQAVLSPGQVSLNYTVKGVPAAARPEWVPSERDSICSPQTEMRLQDGSHLEQQEGGRGSYDANNNYQYVVKFGPIPSKDTQATWYLPCLPETLTGKAPADWEIPLRFVTAPNNLAQLPVMELTPAAGTAAPQGTAPATPSVEPGASPLSLDRVVETQSGYIFIGRFRQALSMPVQPPLNPEIRDGNGLLLGYTVPADISLSSDTTQAIEWAYQVNDKAITWPVTIRVQNAGVFCTDPQAKITFDTGADPQVGQVWELNQDFSIGPCQFRVQFVKWMSKGYLIRLTDLVSVVGVQISPQPEGSMAAGGWSSGTSAYPDHMDVTGTYSQEPPRGVITLYISAYGAIPGPWQVQWQPNK